MDTLQCSFCSHENPVDAKFCNACGSSLNLRLCGHCGAIDHVASAACYKCGTPFGLDTPELGAGSPAAPDILAAQLGDEEPGARSHAPAAPPRVLSDRPWLRAVGLALVVIVTAAVYRLFVTDAPPPPAAIHAASPARGVDAVSGSVTPPPEGARPVGEPSGAAVATAPLEEPPTPETSATPAAPAAADTARSLPYPCTAAVVALGLCE